MKHELTPELCGNENVKYDIYVIELDKISVNIGINITDFSNELNNNQICVNLTQKELHSFIGTLLHVQSKMKGGK